jgi:CMP-N,N'-diacetyllegionaminic acid synthase
MDKSIKRLCTICARGGSKGVKNKNIRLLCDKPLIAHTIVQAKLSGMFEYLAVSSDSEQILKVAKQWGADFCILRPDELANDYAAKPPAIRHCLREVERITGTQFQIFVDLDATSPLRVQEDLIKAVQMLEEKKVSNVITASPARRSPYFNLVELTKYGVAKLSKELEIPVLRRQDSPKCFDMNASIYVWKREAILKETNSYFFEDTALYVMPESRSIDIDTELDFRFVEFLMNYHEDKNVKQ